MTVPRELIQEAEEFKRRLPLQFDQAHRAANFITDLTAALSVALDRAEKAEGEAANVRELMVALDADTARAEARVAQLEEGLRDIAASYKRAPKEWAYIKARALLGEAKARAVLSGEGEG